MELGGGAGGGKERSGVCSSRDGAGDWQACPAQGGRGADLLILKFHTRCKNSPSHWSRQNNLANGFATEKAKLSYN